MKTLFRRRFARSILAALALLAPGAAIAQSCSDLSECYGSATRDTTTHVEVIAPTPGLCEDSVGCVTVRNPTSLEVNQLSQLGIAGLEQVTPYGLAATLTRRPIALGKPAAQINPQGLTLAIRAIPPAHASGRDAALFSMQSVSGAVFEIGVSKSGGLYVGRRNGFSERGADPTFYTFELWDPRSGPKPDAIQTIFVRFGADGHTIVDAISTAGDGAAWHQGLLELGFPQHVGSYPFVGSTKPDRSSNPFSELKTVTVGTGLQGAPAFGALNRMTIVGRALSDPELIALYQTEYAPPGSTALRIDDRPCNTGDYLNFDGAAVRTPCRTIPPVLPKDTAAEGAAMLRIGDLDAVPESVAPGAQIHLQRHDAARPADRVWNLRSFGYGQYALRANAKGNLYLTLPSGSDVAQLAPFTGGVDQAFSLQTRGGLPQWINLGADRPLCQGSKRGRSILMLCTQQQRGELTVAKGAPAPPGGLRAYSEGSRIQIEWDRPPSFPGTPLVYRVRVRHSGGSQEVTVDGLRYTSWNAALNTDYAVEVSAALAADRAVESDPAQLQLRTLADNKATPPPGFALCAADGARCDGSTKEPRLVAFGNAEPYLYAVAEGPIDCRQSAFAKNERPIAGAACFSQPWSERPLGPPGMVFCAQKGGMCKAPSTRGTYVALGENGVYYGLLRHDFADISCRGGSVVSLALRKDYRCYIGTVAGRTDCLNGPVSLGGRCVLQEGPVTLAYFGTAEWFVTVPVTTSIDCTAAAFGYTGKIEGHPTCWTGKTFDVPSVPQGLSFCAVEGSVCPASTHPNQYFGYMRNGGQYNRWFGDMVFVNNGLGGERPCANIVGYKGNTGYGVCFRVPDANVFTSGHAYQYCTSGGGHCLVGPRSLLAYGDNSTRNWRIGFHPHTVTTFLMPCDNDVFGDPDIGADKKCYRLQGR